MKTKFYLVIGSAYATLALSQIVWGADSSQFSHDSTVRRFVADETTDVTPILDYAGPGNLADFANDPYTLQLNELRNSQLKTQYENEQKADLRRRNLPEQFIPYFDLTTFLSLKKWVRKDMHIDYDSPEVRALMVNHNPSFQEWQHLVYAYVAARKDKAPVGPEVSELAFNNYKASLKNQALWKNRRKFLNEDMWYRVMPWLDNQYGGAPKHYSTVQKADMIRRTYAAYNLTQSELNNLIAQWEVYYGQKDNGTLADSFGRQVNRLPWFGNPAQPETESKRPAEKATTMAQRRPSSGSSGGEAARLAKEKADAEAARQAALKPKAVVPTTRPSETAVDVKPTPAPTRVELPAPKRAEAERPTPVPPQSAPVTRPEVITEKKTPIVVDPPKPAPMVVDPSDALIKYIRDYFPPSDKPATDEVSRLKTLAKALKDAEKTGDATKIDKAKQALSRAVLGHVNSINQNRHDFYRDLTLREKIFAESKNPKSHKNYDELDQIVLKYMQAGFAGGIAGDHGTAKEAAAAVTKVQKTERAKSTDWNNNILAAIAPGGFDGALKVVNSTAARALWNHFGGDTGRAVVSVANWLAREWIKASQREKAMSADEREAGKARKDFLRKAGFFYLTESSASGKLKLKCPPNSISVCPRLPPINNSEASLDGAIDKLAMSYAEEKPNSYKIITPKAGVTLILDNTK